MYRSKNGTYSVAWRLKGFARQVIYGIKTEKLAKQTKSEKEVQEQLSRAGLLRRDPKEDKFQAAEEKSASKHVDDFEKDILARGKCGRHAHTQAAHVRRLLEMAKMSRLSAISTEGIQKALHRLRSNGSAPRTCNAARQAIVQFVRYLRKTEKLRSLDLSGLQRFNESEDIRRRRRALSEEEVQWLLATTYALKRDSQGRPFSIPPRSRAMLYAVGIGTGFRYRALLSLRKESFFVSPAQTQPFVRLAAKHNKKRRDRDQFIPRDLADLIRGWLETMPDKGPLWQPGKHSRMAKCFAKDLARARAAWITAADNDDERQRRTESHELKYSYHDGTHTWFADFHGLRHTGITLIVRKAGLRVGQVWADHSTPVLTAKYAHVTPGEMTEALSALPNLGVAMATNTSAEGSPEWENRNGAQAPGKRV